MWLVWVIGVSVVAFLTFAPMFAAPCRGDSAWPWIVAGLLLGPLSGVASYTSRRGIRMAQQRNL